MIPDKIYIPYPLILISMLIITAMMANLGFETIMHYVHNMVSFCYPVIIVLTFVNIAKKFYHLRNSEVMI